MSRTAQHSTVPSQFIVESIRADVSQKATPGGDSEAIR
jgi:hypothetical protein